MSTIPPYVYKDADDSLQQGDIIQLSGYLRRLFKKYYIGLPIKPLETRYLMVINQTCDLVKNQERAPKTEHINLCVVSRFSNYISRLKSKFNKNQISDYCIVEEAVYQEIKNKIVRIINNSEAKEHFFLPQTFPFKEDMVAILSFSYPFRVKHYDLIKKNRVLSIRSDFQSKIGYLIGGLYNRIATPDLNSSNFSDSETSNFVDELLSINNFFPVKKTQYIKYIRENKKRVKTKNSIEVLIKEALNNEEKEKLSQFKKPLIRLLSTNIFKELKEKNIVNPTINESEIRGTLSTILRSIINDIYDEN
ncbi:hypothetical protein ACM9VS_04755 [Legionella pneumophila]|uniref:hypothetical protein n=1 Tax=Legionella pneumophila TaxID=446 RepID=UPI003A4C6CC4